MSTPQSPTIPKIVTPTGEDSTSSSASSSVPISYKKPIRIKNELNEKRRNALKEYYKLKQQQQTLQKEADSLAKQSAGGNTDGSDALINEDDLEDEILHDGPIQEIDLIKSDFKSIVSSTNRLTSSINLINSAIKNIIYNNYYELIKLNQFLGSLNELDISRETSKDMTSSSPTTAKTKPSLLDELSMDGSGNKAKEVQPSKLSSDEILEKLNGLMDDIEACDEKDYLNDLEDRIETSVLPVSITSLLNVKDFKDESTKSKIAKDLNNLIAQISLNNGSRSLIHQLQELQKLIGV